MNKDLIAGLVFSILFHIGILYGDRLMPSHAAPPPPRPEEPPAIQIMELPKEEPEESDEEVRELSDQEAVTNQMAPPSLVDMPSVIPVNAFTQAIQPPPPPGLTAAHATIEVPIVKPGVQLGRNMKDLFNIKDLDQRPEPRLPLNPQYPPDMRKSRIEGVVTIEFIVDSQGSVVEMQILKSSRAEFEMPTLQAVQRWKFRPGKKGGRAVNTRVIQSVTYKLDNRGD